MSFIDELFGNLLRRGSKATATKKAPAKVVGKPTPGAAKPRPGVPAVRPGQKPVATARPAVPAAGQERAVSRGTTVRKIDDGTLQQILAYEGRVLTAEGSDYIRTTPEMRSHIVAFADGTLIIDQDRKDSHVVLSVRAQMKAKGYDEKIAYLAHMSVLRKVYEKADSQIVVSRNNPDAARMQQVFVDMVREAVKFGVSDIHITVGEHEAIVERRELGDTFKVKELSAREGHTLLRSIFTMADASDANYNPNIPQGARITSKSGTVALPVGVQSIRLQFNPLVNGGRYLVARLLYNQEQGSQEDVDTLGYSDDQVDRIRKMRRRATGFAIISGPTGSGKSTTLQRSLSRLRIEREEKVNIITIEDPPEYIIAGAKQIPVLNANTDDERREAFRVTIAASLRSDPNIIMIGEIRDAGSAKLAFEAAMTGHQVWASVHANDGISIVDRLIDIGVESYKATDPSNVIGLIGQRLVRTLCPHCKMSYGVAKEAGVVPEHMIEVLESIPGHEDAIHFSSGKSCGHAKCKDGASGRTVAAEVITPDGNFMRLMRNREKEEAVAYWIKDLGGMTMFEHAIGKMLRGIVDPRTVEAEVAPISEVNLERLPFIMSKV